MGHHYCNWVFLEIIFSYGIKLQNNNMNSHNTIWETAHFMYFI